MMKCDDLDPIEALKLWPIMEPLVVRALAYDAYASTTPEKLQKQVATGFARVLACSEDGELISATLVQLYLNTAQERILHVVCTAGAMADDWLPDLDDKLKEIAADQDCAAITLSGRPGWVRKLRRFGYRTDQVIMRMNNDGWSKQKRGTESTNLEAVH